MYIKLMIRHREDVCAVKYEPIKRLLIIGGYGRHRDFITILLDEYFKPSRKALEQWPAFNKFRYVISSYREESFKQAVARLGKDKISAEKVSSLGRLMR